jgi:hypothetical protein
LLNRVGGDRVQTPLRGPGSSLVALGGGDPLFTLYFNAGAVSPAAALFRAPVPSLDDKPFVFWIARDGETLHMELRATPGALDPLVALVAEI